MKLYHGSNVAIEVIDLSKSRPGKDFGKGFYLSADKQQATEMAESKVAFLGGEPIVTEFEFDENILTSGQPRTSPTPLSITTTSSTAPLPTIRSVRRFVISRTAVLTWMN